MDSIKFIGDLSIQDSKILQHYSKDKTNLLEFGVGASTQIIAQTIPVYASFISLDTEQKWVQYTIENLKRLNCIDKVNFESYKDFDFNVGEKFDFIFNDGYSPLREEFGINSWNSLEEGGIYLVHDTRHINHISHVSNLIKDKYTEIESIYCNKNNSNITIIKKQKNNPYVNWQHVEKSPSWKYGNLKTIPESFWDE